MANDTPQVDVSFFDADQKKTGYFDEAQKPPVKSKGILQTVSENFRTGVETLGAGASIGLNRSPETIASDVADVNRFRPSLDENEYAKKKNDVKEAFDAAPSVGGFIDLLGVFAGNPKQALGEIAGSLGSSLPAYGGAAAGARPAVRRVRAGGVLLGGIRAQ